MRMYFLVPYNISDIQKGIQAGHAALEYASENWNTPEYQEFIQEHKTWIILNGGTTRNGTCSDPTDIGTLNQIACDLAENEITFSVFHEPDLNHALTAICFLAELKVYDRINYPDFRTFIRLQYGVEAPLVIDEKSSPYLKWCKHMGGSKNVFLRNLISGKSLA